MNIRPSIPAIILILFTSVITVSAQVSGMPGAIDPTTGLPIAPAPWKDPDWKDPDVTLTNVSWDGLPLTEVVRLLRDQFGETFDIIVPSSYPDPSGKGPIGADDYSVNLKLKNVKASEIFGAMNMELEAEDSPFRWQLMINGTRQTALLKVRPEFIHPAAELDRKVFFVGDLLNKGMSADKLNGTLMDVWSRAGWSHNGNSIQFYEPGQLVIVAGTKEQIDFMQQTLMALRDQAGITSPVLIKDEKADSPAKEK